MRVALGVVTIVAMVELACWTSPGRDIAQANSVGRIAAPLLSCPDMTGDGSVDLYNDIFGVAARFGSTDGDGTYAFIYDAGIVDGSIDLFNDIFAVAMRFGEHCPLVDQQIAQGTQAILNDPQASGLLTCDEGVLNAKGYIQGSSLVAGQGIHYFNSHYRDGVFDIRHPEGLLCQPDRLVAVLYVVDGNTIGWGPFNPANGAMTGVNIDTFCTVTPCSWDGPESWHAHADLCALHIGTSSAVIIITPTAAACQTANGDVGPWAWAESVGWMSHLWNFVPNTNQILDVNGTMNGRFADCRPPFKAETCPM